MESVEVYLAGVRATQDQSIWALIWSADLIVQLVLLGLVFMSLACWAIIFQ